MPYPAQRPGFFSKIKNVAQVVLYGASLASPVLGLAAGAFMGGVAGAAIGLFAGPVAAVGVLGAYYAAGKLAQHLKKSPAERRLAAQNRDLKKTLKSARAGLARGLAWAVSLSVYVGTLGRVLPNLNWGTESPGAPAQPPMNPANARNDDNDASSAWTAKKLAAHFTSDNAAAQNASSPARNNAPASAPRPPQA